MVGNSNTMNLNQKGGGGGGSRETLPMKADNPRGQRK